MIRNNKLLPLIVAMLALIYVYPLSNYHQYIAGNPIQDPHQPQDPYAHVALTDWFCHNFFNQSFHNPSLFYPNGVNMQISYDSPLLLSLSCLLPISHPVAKFNFIASLQFFLIILAASLIAKKYLKNIFIQLSFIFLYSFSSYFLAQSTQHITLLSTIWSVPLIVYMFSNLDLRKTKESIIAFTSLALSLLAAWQNIPTLFVLVAFFITKHLSKSKSWTIKERRSAFLTLIFCLLLSALILLPFITPFLTYPSQDIYKDFQAPYQYNADLFSFLLPWKNHLYYQLFTRYVIQLAYSGRKVYELFSGPDPLILPLLILSLYISIRTKIISKQHKLWIILATIYFILSLGPDLTSAGHQIFKLKYYWLLYQYPPFSIIRTPARLGVVTTFFILLLTLSLLENILQKFKLSKRIFPPLLLGYSVITTTLLASNFTFPRENYSQHLPNKGLSIINQSATPSAVLNIPLGLQTDATINFLQLYHQHPSFSGYVSYTDQLNSSAYISNNLLLSNLDCGNHQLSFKPNNLEKESPFTNSDSLNQMLSDNSIRYIILNNRLLSLPRCQLLDQFMKQYFIPSINPKLLDQTDYYSVYQYQ